jgi:hypothetical protein
MAAGASAGARRGWVASDPDDAAAGRAMKISITTTANGMVVTDLETKQAIKWADVVEIGYDVATGRTMTYIGTYSDSAIEVTSTPPAKPDPAPAK